MKINLNFYCMPQKDQLTSLILVNPGERIDEGKAEVTVMQKGLKDKPCKYWL